MFKKKEYKRSGWFEGLLDAEQMIKEGYKINHVDDESLWFTKVEDGIKTLCTVSYSSDGRKDGAIDYVEYKRDVLEKLNENP